MHEDWPVIILNSHYDVVPAAEDDWTVDPFAGLRKDGKVSASTLQRMNVIMFWHKPCSVQNDCNGSCFYAYDLVLLSKMCRYLEEVHKI